MPALPGTPPCSSSRMHQNPVLCGCLGSSLTLSPCRQVTSTCRSPGPRSVPGTRQMLQMFVERLTDLLPTYRLSLRESAESEKADTPLPCQSSETTVNYGVCFLPSCVFRKRRKKPSTHMEQTKQGGLAEALMNLISRDGAVLVSLCKHPVSLWRARHACSLLLLCFTWGQEGSREPVQAAPWGHGTWQGAKGGLRSPSSEAGQGADSWEGLPGG